MKRFLLGLAGLLAVLPAAAQDLFPPVSPTGMPYTIVVEQAVVNGIQLPNGATLAVYDGGQIVGKTTFNGSFPLTITAWKGDVTNGLTGFVSGNPVLFNISTTRFDSVFSTNATAVFVRGGTFGTGAFTSARVSAQVSIEPAVQESPSALDFGILRLGQSVEKSFTIKNTGNVRLQVYGICSGNNQVQVLNPDAFTLAKGAERIIQLRFSPNAALPMNGTISISSDDPARNSASVAVRGQGLPAVQAQISLNQQSISFGLVENGQQLKRSVLVRNVGTDTLRITSVSQSQPARFVKNTLPAKIAPGKAAELEVVFKPTANGQVNDNISIQSNSVENSTITLNLSGTGYTSAFAPVVVTGIPYQIVVNALSVDNSGLSQGDEIAILAADKVVGKTVFGGSYPVSISAWKANAAAGLSGWTSADTVKISVYTNRYNAAVQVPLTTYSYNQGNGKFGTGAFTALSASGFSGRAPGLVLDASPMLFASARRSETLSIDRKLFNTGVTPLTVELNISGAFSIAGSNYFTIPAGDSSVVTIRFSPPSIGLLNSTLGISSNSLFNANRSISLSGRGVIDLPASEVQISLPSTWLEAELGDSVAVEVPLENKFTYNLTANLSVESVRGNRVFFKESTVEVEKLSTRRNGLVLKADTAGIDTLHVVMTLSNGRVVRQTLRALAHPAKFATVEPTGKPWSIIVSAATTPGESFKLGDEIAVFDGENAVGRMAWRETPDNQLVTVWEKNDANPGFTAGNTISYKIWKSTTRNPAGEVLVPFQVNYSIGNRFKTSAYARVGIVVNEPPYFRHPKKTIVYETNAFSVRSYARQDTLTADANGQSLTRTFTTDNAGLSAAVVSNLVRLTLQPEFSGEVNLIQTATDGTYTTHDTTKFIIAFRPRIAQDPGQQTVYETEQRPKRLNGVGGIFYHPVPAQVRYNVVLSNPAIADVIVRNDSLLIFGKLHGSTSAEITATEVNGFARTLSIPVNVVDPKTEWTWWAKLLFSKNGTADSSLIIGAGAKATNNTDSFYDVQSAGNAVVSLSGESEEAFKSLILPDVSLADTMQVWTVSLENDWLKESRFSVMPQSEWKFPIVVEYPEKTFFRLPESGWEIPADASGSFNVLLGDTTAPTISPDAFYRLPRILRSGDGLNKRWENTDGFQVNGTGLEISFDSGNSFAAVDTHLYKLPEETIRHNVALRIHAEDVSGNRTFWTTEDVFSLVGDSLSTEVQPGWNMFSIPMEQTTDVFADRLSQQLSGTWIGYRYENGGYLRASSPEFGSGIWLGASLPASVGLKGAPKTDGTDVALALGWNMISNPLPRAVHADSLVIKRNLETKSVQQAVSAGWITGAYSYDRGYSSSGWLQPWSAQWLAAITDSVKVHFPVHRLHSAVEPSEKTTETKGWTFEISAQIGKTVQSLRIGQLSTSTDGFDPVSDIPKPPPIPDVTTPDIYLRNESIAQALGDRFIADVRASKNKGQEDIWEIRASNMVVPGVVKWAGSIPDSVTIELRLEDGDWTRLSQLDSLGFSAAQKIYVRATVGEAVRAEAMRTYTYKLSQNYPNPFNPSTKIVFELEKAGNVTLEVLNMLGQSVATLTNKPYSAGEHAIVFDAKNLSNGVYFYRMRANQFQTIKKMTLVK